jgi:putative addiction module antidote
MYLRGGIYMNVVLRKTGNSTVITIPNKIREALGAKIGEEIEFVTSGNNVIIRKAEPKFDFDKELEKAMNQYDDLLKALVDK